LPKQDFTEAKIYPQINPTQMCNTEQRDQGQSCHDVEGRVERIKQGSAEWL
jgi:hypothetical protein